MNYQIMIKSVSGSDTVIIKVLITITPNLDLKHAVELYNYLKNHGNSTLVMGLSEKVANHIAENLKSTGAELSIVESSIKSPMMCLPGLTKKYKWNSFRQIEEIL